MKKIVWKKNRRFRPDHILSKIEDAKRIGPDGKLSYSSFEYHDAFAAIFSMIDFPAQVKEELSIDSLVSKALGKTARAGKITKESFIETLNEEVKSELATTEKKYRLLTSLSMCGQTPFKVIVIGKTRIQLVKDYPKKYGSRISMIQQLNKGFKENHKGYTKVIATTKAKSTHAAATKALRDIDIARALLCLFTNASMELFGMNSSKPINRIRLGQTHTLHDESGANATAGTVWYDESFREAEPYQIINLSTVDKNIKWALDRLSICKYQEVLKDSLIRFVSALDEANHNTALTKLWGAVECIAAPSEPNYDAVTRRCAFIFEEHQYHKQVLEHLREFRNQNIHTGSGSDRAKTYCYQMQFYYRELLIFHLHNFHDFEDLNQANNFLDLPTDKAALLSRKKLLQKALKFRKLDNDE